MHNYHHVINMVQQILPEKDWDRIRDDWPDFESLDHGDNEPFALIREALVLCLYKSYKKDMTCLRP